MNALNNSIVCDLRSSLVMSHFIQRLEKVVTHFSIFYQFTTPMFKGLFRDFMGQKFKISKWKENNTWFSKSDKSVNVLVFSSTESIFGKTCFCCISSCTVVFWGHVSVSFAQLKTTGTVTLMFQSTYTDMRTFCSILLLLVIFLI